MRPLTASLFAAAITVTLSACVDGGLRSDYRAARDRVNAFLAANPDVDAGTASAMRAFELQDGMSMPQVIAAWGRPALVQKFSGGTVQYWYFGCDWPHHCTDPDNRFPAPDEVYQSRALFQNGTLVEWQS